MTVNEMQAGVRIGYEYMLGGVMFGSHDVHVRVIVRDIRTVYGTVQVEVEPAAGKGLAWVMASRLRPID